MPNFAESPWSDLIDAVAQQAGVIGQVLIIAFVAWLVLRLSEASIRRIVERLVASESGPGTVAELGAVEAQKRVDTINGLLLRLTRLLVVLIAGAMVLEALSISVAPAIAGLGIIGIAVGFGAQHLVRDYLNGALILLENQFSRGDVIKVAGVAGLVEDFNLRRTTLRDLDGIVHVVPNGEISVASNLTRGWGRVNENILVGYGTDVEAAAEIIRNIGAAMAAEPAWSSRILEAPRLERVESLADNGIQLKILATVGPMDRWAVAGELRKRLLLAFTEAGVEIPFPHRVVVSRTESSDGGAVLAGTDGAVGGPATLSRSSRRSDDMGPGQPVD
jgi:small conductance mechanosensitive channel